MSKGNEKKKCIFCKGSIKKSDSLDGEIVVRLTDGSVFHFYVCLDCARTHLGFCEGNIEELLKLGDELPRECSHEKKCD